MLVACLGDVMLDVIVETERPLSQDDDTPARVSFEAGGQAANVATWVTALDASARVFGPRSPSGTGLLVETALSTRGVEVWGPPGQSGGHAGAVVSLLSDGNRTMASDPGDLTWLDDVRFGAWVEDADWLFVSGYALLRTPDPQRIVETAAVARARGTRIAIDLASAAMVTTYGAHRFSDLCAALRPAVVFATDAEWDTSPGSFGVSGGAVLVLKHGPHGASFVTDGQPDHREALPGPVLDATGAGDALAAGYLVGGADLAMQTAARCVGKIGAQP